MKRYTIIVRYRSAENGEECSSTTPGYYAETAWHACLTFMTKPQVAILRGNRFISIEAQHETE